MFNSLTADDLYIAKKLFHLEIYKRIRQDFISSNDKDFNLRTKTSIDLSIEVSGISLISL
jgi:hypothetical protein